MSNRPSITPFTQVADTMNGLFPGAPPVQVPPPIHEDMFLGVTQGITQTQVMETSENNLPPAEVNGVLARVVDLVTGAKIEFLASTSEISLGRSPQNTIPIRDPNVSSRHLRIFRDEFSFALVDSSVNGTYVNGVPLVKNDPRRLQSGDEFSLVQNSYKTSDRARHVFMFVEPPVVFPHTRQVMGDPESVLTYYHLGRCIGKGNFSEVHIGVNRDSGERVAIKVVDTAKTEQFSKRSRSVTLNIDSEMKVLQSLDHPNIIKFYGMYRSANHVHLVIEYADGGDLLNRILEQGCYNETDGRKVFYEICSGVAYLHERDICHRDLKPDNVLLTAEGVAKISDFGLARHASQSENNFRTYCGTPHYFAPEMFMLQRQQVAGYGKAVDVWSLGVILYIIVSGKPPFDDENLSEQVVNGIFEFDGPEFESVSESAKDLISRLMTVDPNMRLTTQEALKHPWLLDYANSLGKSDDVGGMPRKADALINQLSQRSDIDMAE